MHLDPLGVFIFTISTREKEERKNACNVFVHGSWHKKQAVNCNDTDTEMEEEKETSADSTGMLTLLEAGLRNGRSADARRSSQSERADSLGGTSGSDEESAEDGTTSSSGEEEEEEDYKPQEIDAAAGSSGGEAITVACKARGLPVGLV
jgi:hypothetical protein